MPYDEYQVDRISQCLRDKNADFISKKMFGGMLFMLDDKMLCGVHYDKKKKTDLLMARIGIEASPAALLRSVCHPMDFTGRPMRGYVFVTPKGYDSDNDLDYWMQLCLDFNPLAKATKKKNK